MKRAIAAGVMLATLAMGCHRSVLIDSEPTGAKVRVNGIPRGTTPFRTNLEYTAFTNFEVMLEKEGYRPATARLPMEFSAGALICGVVCWPFLLVVQQPASTVFVLERARDEDAAATDPVPAATPDVTSGASGL